jgi:hypothetical protein
LPLRRGCLPEQLVFVINAAEELAHLDASFGISATTWTGGNISGSFLPRARRIGSVFELSFCFIRGS